MEKVIKDLEKEKEDLRKRISDIDEFIKSFQKVCKHKKDDGTSTLEYDGHDSHHDYYKCTICGYEYTN